MTGTLQSQSKSRITSTLYSHNLRGFCVCLTFYVVAKRLVGKQTQRQTIYCLL